jgi:hypothetical protein
MAFMSTGQWKANADDTAAASIIAISFFMGPLLLVVGREELASVRRLVSDGQRTCGAGNRRRGANGAPVAFDIAGEGLLVLAWVLCHTGAALVSSRLGPLRNQMATAPLVLRDQLDGHSGFTSRPRPPRRDPT